MGAGMVRRTSLSIVVALLAAIVGIAQGQTTAPAPSAVRIGVLSYRGAGEVMGSWQPTADYLHGEIPSRQFVIVPLDWDGLSEAVAGGQVDFVITNPASYVELEMRYAATRILTLKRLRQGQVCRTFGAVIFTRDDRTEIQTLSELRGRTFMVAHAKSFGGWWMAWRELKTQGIDVERDLTVAYGGTQDAVVYAVRDRKVDAGTVRTDELEQMAAEGKVDLKAFRILNPQPPTEQFPFMRSTRLYPEWAMAAMRNTSDELAADLAMALLRMPTDCAAARAAQSAGWTVPLNYTPVHDCLRELNLGPYRYQSPVTFRTIWSRYRYSLVSGGLGIILLVGSTLWVLRLNRRLKRLHTELAHELEGRRRAEAQLIQAARMELVGQLASGVAHEVRNPLAVAQAGMDYLNNHVTSPDVNVATILKTMNHALKRADRIIRGLLDFSASRHLQLAPRDINSVIKDALALVHHEQRAANVTLVTELAAVLPPLPLDDARAEQVFVNLLLNALHAMQRGGTLTVRTSARQLTDDDAATGFGPPGRLRGGDYVVVTEVEDTGAGIPPEDLRRIFDPFYTTKAPGKGTGLGLTVARTIVEQHGGAIGIRNRHEGGVRATVVFKAPTEGTPASKSPSTEAAQ